MALARTTLFALHLLGIYVIFYFAWKNGLKETADSFIERQILPDTATALSKGHPMRTVYTGVEPIDRLLVILGTFFWTVLDGSSPDLLLHSVIFSGTFGSAWVLILLEGWRRGNSGIITLISVFGFIAQTCTFALSTTLYGCLHLRRSVTVVNPTPQNISVSPAVLRAIPFIFLVGYQLPTILTILRAPERISIDLKQIFIAIWQPWPIYVSILAGAVHYITSLFTSPETNATKANQTQLTLLRRVYAFAFAHTAITHILGWTVSLATVLAPVLFNPKFIPILHPARVFRPTFPFLATDLRIESVGQGVHIFLQWDFLIGSLGTLVWAMGLWAAAQKKYNLEWRNSSTVLGLGLFVKVALLMLVAGPVAAAVELMWERDELVFAQRPAQEPSGKEVKRVR